MVRPCSRAASVGLRAAEPWRPARLGLGGGEGVAGSHAVRQSAQRVRGIRLVRPRWRGGNLVLPAYGPAYALGIRDEAREPRAGLPAGPHSDHPPSTLQQVAGIGRHSSLRGGDDRRSGGMPWFSPDGTPGPSGSEPHAGREPREGIPVRGAEGACAKPSACPSCGGSRLGYQAKTWSRRGISDDASSADHSSGSRDQRLRCRRYGVCSNNFKRLMVTPAIARFLL